MPDVGRFVSQDPIGLFGGTNSYLYAPNPNGWVDPGGLSRAQRKILPKNARKNLVALPCVGCRGLEVSEPGARKVDLLFENENDAMNAGSRMRGPGAVRTYIEKANGMDG
ncbi:MAG TPA: RHS repeat-associated core domain-containing protein [Tahibacter sp.]|uniref:RHS repeat-associated core domain-containing protein n=1 Tax=Tahibacter sp. TaxID=2056211 RepID=UPI002BBFD8C3|nr:RHS repeat-associated core domain-containing protein [Tahibacter sp.]HSX62893.1 RHS repeat-associated core domain-containing protein [Tahibacter sp.]